MPRDLLGHTDSDISRRLPSEQFESQRRRPARSVDIAWLSWHYANFEGPIAR
jgi:hypothetical protein